MRLSIIQHLILATSIFTIILIIGIFAVSHVAVIKGIENTERDIAPHIVEKILAVLSLEEESLARIAYDWGVWDDTYQFMQNHTDQYVRSNLATSSLIGIQVNDILFFDREGNLWYGISADYHNGTSRQVPADLVDYYYRSGLNKTKIPLSGIVPLSSGPVVIAIHPIVRSDESGEPQGMILIGRDLDENRITYLSNYTLYPFSIGIAGSEVNEQPDDHGLIDTNTNSVISLGTVVDIKGNPSYIAKMEIPYYSPYTREVLQIMAILVIILSTLFFIVLLSYYRYFLGRHITEVSDMLDLAIHSGASIDNVRGEAPPELITLAESAERVIRYLFQNRDDLTLSRYMLEEVEERWQMLFEEAADPMFIGDQESILNANRSWIRLFGCEREDVENLSIRDLTLPFLPDGTNPMVSLINQYYSVPDNGLIRFNWRVADPDDRELYFDVTIKTVMYRGKLLRMVIARDISVQVKMQDEQSVALSQIEENLVQLGTLNDEIRNPLTVILGLIEDEPCSHREEILHQVKKIDAIIDRLDRGYLDSEKVRHHLMRTFDLGRR